MKAIGEKKPFNYQMIKGFLKIILLIDMNEFQLSPIF